MKVASIQVGTPVQRGTAGSRALNEREWTSGIYKDRVEGTIKVFEDHLLGDGQADLENHGGPDKAINCYPAEHLPFWRERLGIAKIGPGAFGENFSTEGALETNVCIGDVYAGTAAAFQVTQPRQPCWKLARKWGVKKLPAYFEKELKMGWYLRVLKTGFITVGETLTLEERPNPDWTIARIYSVMMDRQADRNDITGILGLAGLSTAWRELFASRT